MTAIVLAVVGVWAASVWTVLALLHGGRKNWERERP